MPEAKDILKAIETARTLYNQAEDVADSIKGMKDSYENFQQTILTGKQKLDNAAEAVQNGDLSGALKLTVGSIIDLKNPLQDIRSTVGHAVLDKSTEKLGDLCSSITGYDVDLDKMSSGLSNMASTAETGVSNFIKDPSISTALDGVKKEALSTEDITTSVLKPIAQLIAKEGVEWAVRAIGEAATDAVAAALSETVIGSVAAEVVGKVATEVAAEVAGHIAENVAGDITEQGIGGAYKVGGTVMDVVTGNKDISDIPQDIGDQLTKVAEKGVTSAISSVTDPLTKVPGLNIDTADMDTKIPGMSTEILGMSTDIPGMKTGNLPNMASSTPMPTGNTDAPEDTLTSSPKPSVPNSTATPELRPEPQGSREEEIKDVNSPTSFDGNLDNTSDQTDRMREQAAHMIDHLTGVRDVATMDANNLPSTPKPSITDTLKPSPSDSVEVDQSLKVEDKEKTGLKLDIFSGDSGAQMENRLGADVSGHGTTRTSTLAQETSLNDLSHSDAPKMKPEPEPKTPKNKSPFSIPNPNDRPELRPDEND